MKRVYISAAWLNIGRARLLSSILIAEGIHISSTWHDKQHDSSVTDAGAEEIAANDMAEISGSDALVFLPERTGTLSRGNRHVELGYALGLGKTVVILGEPELLLHRHPSITCVSRFSELVKRLGGGM